MSEGEVKIDAVNFHTRLGKLVAAWKDASNADDFGKTDCVVILAGKSDDEVGYQKTSCLQLWLLGYEFPDTALILLADKVLFFGSQKKASMVEATSVAKGVDIVPIEVFKKGKDAAANTEMLEVIFKKMEGSHNGKRMGILSKDKVEGKFVSEWKECIKGKGFEEVDISSGIASVLALKDENDLKNVKIACRATGIVMKNYFVDEFANIMDVGRKISHEKLSNLTMEVFTDAKKRAKLKLPKDISADACEWCYPPIIQSGGKYDLKPSAISDSTNLHEGTVLCSLGVRYRSYCSNISRTFLVNPEKGKERNYNFLVELQSILLEFIKAGVTCREVYNKAVSIIEEKRPDLSDNFVKNIGYGIGIEFKESAFALAAKSTRTLKTGMILNLTLGFHNVENKENTSDPRNKTYSLLLGDVILVTDDKPIMLTEYDKNFKDISWEMNEEDEDDIMDVDVKPTRNSKATGTASGVKQKLRERDENDVSQEQKRALHQKQLVEQRNSEGLSRFIEGADTSKAAEKATFRRFECYRKESLIPKAVDQLRIYVDRKSEAIILPIYGMPVPFHVSTLKTLVKNEEADTVYLRFNFITPGQSIGKKESNAPFENPNSTFIKTIMFKSTDMGRFAEIHKDIMDFKKEISKKEAERKEMADLVEQAKLVEVKGRRPITLRDVVARPALDGKKLPGDLEIHTNGLRYQSALRHDMRIDILFSNVRHLFFQSCEGELIVVLHVHLKNPIMIGRKKTKDVQFYREVSEASVDETGNRKRRYNQGDEDEFLAEQEERKRRAQLNTEFKGFAEKIADASRNLLEVDAPLRDLGFQGVPYKQPVLLLPTVNCLVHLIEMPFVVITISDIELVHLERVRFGLKSFDMVVIYKDFTRPVQHINSIPVEILEHVKEWLDSIDVAFTEGPTNLSWPQIMKTINEDPADFFKEGGWSFLQQESDGEDDEEEEESEYEAESEDFNGESSESDDGSGSGSGSDFSDDGDEEEDDGEDWDELERKAAKKKEGRDDDSPPRNKKANKGRDDEPPKKKAKK